MEKKGLETISQITTHNNLKNKIGQITSILSPSGCSFIIFDSRRRAFTLVELIVVVAILGTLAAIIVPRTTWTEPPKRALQRAFVEAVDMTRSGASVRFRIDKEENRGAIIPEIFVKDENTGESNWKEFKMQWQPVGNQWNFDPEIIYFSQNGICTPAKITWGVPPQGERFLLTVTGYLVESDR